MFFRSLLWWTFDLGKITAFIFSLSLSEFFMWYFYFSHTLFFWEFFYPHPSSTFIQYFFHFLGNPIPFQNILSISPILIAFSPIFSVPLFLLFVSLFVVVFTFVLYSKINLFSLCNNSWKRLIVLVSSLLHHSFPFMILLSLKLFTPYTLSAHFVATS